jgi:hypothetical protein
MARSSSSTNGSRQQTIYRKDFLKRNNLRASRTANGTGANIESEARLSQLRQLYFNSFTNLQSAAFDQFPELSAPDCYSAMERVAALLPEYKGPPDGSVSFERWGKRKAIEESFRHVCLTLAMGKYKRMIFATIAAEMWTSAQDRSVEPEDLFSDVLMLIFNRAPMFLKNKRAKLSTRLCALARKHVYLYYNSRNRKRLSAVTERIENGEDLGAETLSAIEMASIKNDAAYDPGYREAGLSLE